MFSRRILLFSTCRVSTVLNSHGEPLKMQVRRVFFPPTPYDSPILRKLNPSYMFKYNWECIPIFVVTGISIAWIIFHTIYAFRNKVDIVLLSHDNKNCISRTMDLRNPTVHKMFTITQQYEPWPEMQDVLDKMREAELAQAEIERNDLEEEDN